MLLRGVRHPISWDLLLEGQDLVLGSGRPRSFVVSGVGVLFRGEVGRNRRLAGRSGAPRALLGEKRRGVI